MICPFCAEEIKDQAILCRYCGKDLPGTQSTSSQSITQESVQLAQQDDDSSVINQNGLSKFSKQQKIIGLVLIAVLAITGGSLGFNKYSQVKETNRIAAIAQAQADAEEAALQAELEAYQAAVRDTSWVPSGFTKFSKNPYLAYKKNSASCASYGACFPFDLVTSKFCSSVYISGNLERNGIIIDFTNDTANGISAGKIVKMKLQWTEDRGDNVGWVDVNCR